jgi:hypothetical protein
LFYLFARRRYAQAVLWTDQVVMIVQAYIQLNPLGERGIFEFSSSPGAAFRPISLFDMRLASTPMIPTPATIMNMAVMRPPKVTGS